MDLKRLFAVYLVPGAIFQSILVGGGYGTGREVVEYFTNYGPIGGFLAQGVAFLSFAVVLVLTFELSRRFEAYDYRAFFKVLLGRYWFIYEVCAFTLLMLVFAVLISAGSTVLHDAFGWPAWIGIVLVLVLVGALEFFGRETVMGVLTFWSIILYAVFIAFLVQTINATPQKIVSAFSDGGIEPGWAVSGFKFAMYNMTAAPIILYVARKFRSQKEAVGSGIVAALIAVIPAATFHIAFSGSVAELASEAVPVYWIMNTYGMDFLVIVFTIMLFGTLIETGAGVLQGVNERLDSWRKENEKPALARWQHAGVAIGLMVFAIAIASIGVVQLIGKGYGTLAWGFFALYFVPLVTVGVVKIIRAPK